MTVDVIQKQQERNGIRQVESAFESTLEHIQPMDSRRILCTDSSFPFVSSSHPLVLDTWLSVRQPLVLGCAF